jgi:ribosomal protein S18 acetylase RimI-like enzyme
MTAIRPYAPRDLDALYRICLLTADAGGDGRHLYRDPMLVGHVYAGPYGALFPGMALVVEDDEGVAGYIVGAADTLAYEAHLEREWWPALRARYRDPTSMATVDERMMHLIHHPETTPSEIAAGYPAHLHINLLPREQGQGWGTRLMDAWLALAHAAGAPAAHLGVGVKNTRAVAFYRRYGFREFGREDGGRTLLMGIGTGPR